MNRLTFIAITLATTKRLAMAYDFNKACNKLEMNINLLIKLLCLEQKRS